VQRRSNDDLPALKRLLAHSSHSRQPIFVSMALDVTCIADLIVLFKDVTRESRMRDSRVLRDFRPGKSRIARGERDARMNFLRRILAENPAKSRI
jgi:hypothetical protein